MKPVKNKAAFRSEDRSLAKATAKLRKLRDEIDDVDKRFLKSLAHRFKIVAEVGKLKVRNGFPLLQKNRMLEMLNGRRDDAKRLKLDGQLIYDIFDLIHDASLKHQEDVAKKYKKTKAKKK